MHDIIPGGGTSDDRHARPLRPRVGKKSQARNFVYAGPRTVQLQWKLPSRLRKPIRPQLARQRAQKKRRQTAAVTFARKPLHTQPLLVADMDSKTTGARVKKPRRFFNRGAEHNTGDVYSQSKPELHVAAPPYVGRAVRARAGSKATHTARAPVAGREQVRNRSHAPIPRHPQRLTTPIAQERDIPMEWEQNMNQSQHATDDLFVPVEQPKRIMSGVTFNLWPGNWFGRQRQAAPATASKKKPLT